METALAKATEQAIQLEELCAEMIFSDHPAGGVKADHTPEGRDFWGQTFEVAQAIRTKLEGKWTEQNPITLNYGETMVLPDGQIIGKEKEWKNGGSTDDY